MSKSTRIKKGSRRAILVAKVSGWAADPGFRLDYAVVIAQNGVAYIVANRGAKPCVEDLVILEAMYDGVLLADRWKLEAVFVNNLSRAPRNKVVQWAVVREKP
jgi:hypothetical protein